jgi:hypothetical protein
MTDTSIRRVTLAEQAEAAARRYLHTGEREPNPHAGTDDERAYQLALDRWLHALIVPHAEGSA